MADLTVTPYQVSVLPGAMCRPAILRGPVNVGDSVYVTNTPDGTSVGVAQSNAGAANTAKARGIVVSIEGFGLTSGVAGQGASICYFGPVTGIVGTPGATGYASNTAGKIADAAGTTSQVMGFQESANVFFVNPLAS